MIIDNKKLNPYKTEYSNYQEMYERLLPYVISKEKVRHSPYTGTSLDKKGELYYYQINKSTKNILLSVKNVYNWDGESLPEELCLLRDDIWFACITHENYCYIDYTEEDIKFCNREGIVLS